MEFWEDDGEIRIGGRAGMVETEEHNAYSVVEVYSDFLKILGFGREPNRILTFRKDNL